MRKSIGFLIFYTLILGLNLFQRPDIVSAHTLGQPPFFKINGQYANLYPVPLTSLDDFNLPLDQAPDNYLTSQLIHFELDKDRVPIPAAVFQRSKFFWEFGDGQKASGISTGHAYSKIGSFILKIYIDDGISPAKLLDSAKVDILPDKNYQLPQAVIKVNSQKSKDPLTDILKLDFSQTLSFDGLESTAKSSKLISFRWDFGDSKSANSPVASHLFASDLSQVFPVLRVEDANGVFNDSYIELQNSLVEPGVMSTATLTAKPKTPTRNNWLPGLTVALPAIIIAALIALNLKK